MDVYNAHLKRGGEAVPLTGIAEAEEDIKKKRVRSSEKALEKIRKKIGR